MIEQVLREEAQFGIGQLVIDSQRLYFVDYTAHTYLYKAVYMARKGKPAEPFLKVLEPLDPRGWAGFVLTAVIVTVVVVCVIQFHPHLVNLNVSPANVIC